MLSQHLRYAARTLRKSPVFTVAAVVTLSFGVGVSTAIFTITDAELLRPLPYPHPERLVLVFGEFRRRGVTDWPFSHANFMDLQSRARAMFDDFGAVFTARSILRKEDGTPEQVRTASVTANFFRVLGARVALGRDFVGADEQRPPQTNTGSRAESASRLARAAILSYEYWQRRYGGNLAILGSTLADGTPIVGVMAPGLQLLFPPSFDVEHTPDIWIPERLNYNGAERNNVSLRVIGRLKDGVKIEQAQAETETIAAEIRRVDHNHNTADYHIRIEPMHRYLMAEVRPVLVLLLGAVIFLLLIACANVANLFLVQTAVRERELAVRAALGGSRWRLVQQVLIEAVLLSGLGTLFGLGLAWAGVRYLLVIAPASLPRLESVAIDSVTLGFTVLAGLAATALFGLLPAWQASRPDMNSLLRTAGRNVSLGAGQVWCHAVLVIEIALSFVLLIGAGLLFRSLVALQHIDLGYDPHGVLTFQVSRDLSGSTPQQRAALMREIQEHLRTLPGIQDVTASNPLPLAGGFFSIRWGTEQALADPTQFQAAEPQTVLPGYFETMHTPLLTGRTFTGSDNRPERNGVMIDQLLAAKAFPKQSAVGRRILVRIRTSQPEWVEVIGVVAHQHTTSLTGAGREQVYFTDGFMGYGEADRWIIRTTGDPAKLAGRVRTALAGFDPHLFITEMQPMDALVAQAQAKTRFSLTLMGLFATVATSLAAVGLYGGLSTLVQQRTAEIGVRMALGASPTSILNLVVGRGLLLTAAGLAIGSLGALGLTRWMTSLLVNVKVNDPPTFSIMTALFVIIAVIASWLLARRAARLGIVAALRHE